MESIVVLGLLTLFGVSLAVGIKLLLLARRTGAFPEFALGFYFLVGGGVGYPLSGAAPFMGTWQSMVAIASTLCTGTATVMLYSFTARVFRPGQWTGRLGVALGTLLSVVYCAGYAWMHLTATTEADIVRGTMAWGGVSLVMSLGAFGWTGIESMTHYRRHRRRQALGLADPVVTNRMLLWGLMGLTTCGIVVVDGGLLYSGSDFAREMLIPLVTSVGGLLFGAFLALAFFPPDFYLRIIRGRAGGEQGAH
jgi:hypothetical protein